MVQAVLTHQIEVQFERVIGARRAEQRRGNVGPIQVQTRDMLGFDDPPAGVPGQTVFDTMVVTRQHDKNAQPDRSR